MVDFNNTTLKNLEDKTMSKLYTEEQVKMMLVRAKIFDGKVGDDFIFILSEKDILESITPIQLPTDEEVYELAKEQYPISMEKFGNEMMDGNIYFRSIFIQGVEWMRDKIKGGQGE